MASNPRSVPTLQLQLISGVGLNCCAHSRLPSGRPAPTRGCPPKNINDNDNDYDNDNTAKTSPTHAHFRSTARC
eukprot:11216702-Lingulodinium_polyedra.AAC.1